MATGSSHAGQSPPGPMRRQKHRAVRAILLTERARLACWAFIDGAWPRGSRRDRRQRSRVTTTPRRLAAGRGAEALPTNPGGNPRPHTAQAVVVPPSLRDQQYG